MAMSNYQNATEPTQDEEGLNLNDLQRLALLRTAREAIKEAVCSARVAAHEELDQALMRPAAVFVTLWQRTDESEPGSIGNLRGCIGRLQPDYPLYVAVKNAAISAATRDPRFTPVCSEELNDILIEISILSPLVEIKDLHDVIIGRDGLLIEAGGRRGLLLPKVATRLQWNRMQFYQNVCLKAGLPIDIWPRSGKLFRFTSVEFHE